MKIPSKLLIRLALAYGIMNRETFEAQISRLLSDYTDNPEDLNKYYDFLFSQMNEYKELLTLEHIMEATNSAKSTGSAEDMREEINELKKAIEMLTEKLDKKEGK